MMATVLYHTGKAHRRLRPHTPLAAYLMRTENKSKRRRVRLWRRLARTRHWTPMQGVIWDWLNNDLSPAEVRYYWGSLPPRNLPA